MTWEPLDIDPDDRYGIREVDDKWDYGKITKVEQN